LLANRLKEAHGFARDKIPETGDILPDLEADCLNYTFRFAKDAGKIVMGCFWKDWRIDLKRETIK